GGGWGGGGGWLRRKVGFADDHDADDDGPLARLGELAVAPLLGGELDDVAPPAHARDLRPVDETRGRAAGDERGRDAGVAAGEGVAGERRLLLLVLVADLLGL